MGIGIAHLNVLPFLYAIALVAGFFSVWNKFATGLLWIALTELGFFAATFMLHGGSMTGSLAAVLAAMGVGYVLKRKHMRKYADKQKALSPS